jgi:acylphosphatase
MKRRAHLYISGFVQGVFFRSNTRSYAIRNNVKGWVKNLPDGRVEAVLEGEESDVRRVISLCEKGPPGAKVTKVEVKWEEYEGEFSNFTIRYF